MVLTVFRHRMKEGADLAAYAALSKRMHELVHQHPGFISIESFTSPTGEEVSLELFETDAALMAWRANPEHLEAQRRGREEFYAWFSYQTSEVIRKYEIELVKNTKGEE